MRNPAKQKQGRDGFQIANKQTEWNEVARISPSIGRRLKVIASVAQDMLGVGQEMNVMFKQMINFKRQGASTS